MIIVVCMRVAKSGPSAMRLIEDSSFDDEEHSLAVSESFQKGGKSFKKIKNWGPYGVEYNNFKRFKGYNTIAVQFGWIFGKKMFEPMKSLSIQFGLVFNVFQKRNQTKLVGLDRFG